MTLKDAKRIHVLGAGGIGVSAVARLLKAQGKEVTGYDSAETEVTAEVQKLGIPLTFGPIPTVPDTDLVLYSMALKQVHGALFDGLTHKGVPMMSYPESLSEISATKKTIAIAGTHGKTTTTAMTARVLIDAKLSPTVIVGSMLLPERSNFITGESNLLVVEADEYKRSFMSLNPTILVINNIDEDHLDYYKDLADIQKAFRELAEKVPTGGTIIADLSMPNVQTALEGLGNIVDVSKLPMPEGLQMPGEHNRRNARMAQAVARVLGVTDEQSVRALQSFTGVWRRFELKGKTQKDALVYDDYAHNPHKLAAALHGAHEVVQGKVIALFQPHLFSRTKHHLNEFAEALKLADKAFVLPIYPAREAFDPTITSEMLAERARELGADAEASLKDAAVASALLLAGADDLIMLIGAGDVTELAQSLVGK